MATDIIARGLASKANNSIEGIKVGGSPYIGDNGNWYVWDSGTSAYKDSNIKAEGVNGEPGKGIVSIERTSGTGEAGTTDTYTITYTDNTTSTYNVYNGKDGKNGTDGTDGITPSIGKNGNWYIGDVDTGISATGYTTVPVASATTLGGIKVGENLNITEDGTLNAQASTEDVIIPYKTFTDYSDEEKTSIADKLLNCINAVKSLTKICYLEVDDLYYPLYRISAIENNIDFIFTVILGFTQIQVTYAVSTMSNTLINVTLNTYDSVDSAMSDTSTKPVQNKVIKSYVDKNVATLVDVGNIDWDEVTPNTKGYIANKPFGRVNTFANTTNILFENTTHTGGMHYENVVFNIDFPSGFAENIENITMATLQYSGKTYNIRTTSSAPLKRTCTENKTYSKILEYTGEFSTESIIFKLELSKKVKRTDGTTTLEGTLTCNINDLIASGIISEIPEDQTVNLTFGLKVTTAGTKIKVIDSAYLPVATENNIGAVKPGTGLTIDEQGSINVSVDSAMSDTSTNAVQNKVVKQYVDNLVGNIETVLQTINSGSGV